MATTTDTPGVHANVGGMLMVEENRPFGHLIHFEGKGVYDPSHGQVDVDPSLVDAHNTILDEALVKGLVENCKVGQGYFFYYRQKDGKTQVTTFTGVVVSDDVTLKGKSLTFTRLGKTYRGTLKKDEENFNFTRVA